MNDDTKTMHVTPVGGNIFADLGFAPEEAAALHADSQRLIAEKRALKVQLMSEISGWIDAKHLKQGEAAEILGVNRLQVSDIINRKSIKFSIDSLVEMVARTGKQVMLSVR
jgi:predicted XRE-type DNA-binding protein